MPIAPGDELLIFGAGPMGLLLLQAVKHDGAGSVTMVDLKENRLAVARELGADLTVSPGPALTEALRGKHARGFDVAAADLRGLSRRARANRCRTSHPVPGVIVRRFFRIRTW